MPRAPESVPLGGPRALLVCNLLLVFAAFWAVWSYEKRGEEERFLRLVDRTNAELQTDLDLALSLVRGVGGLFAASAEVELPEFRAYVEALDLRGSHPSLLGLGYAVQVGPDGVAAVEARMAVYGQRDFELWPPPRVEDDAAIVYLEPPDRGNVEALGYVMTSDPTRRRAMMLARDTGEPVATDAVTLVQEEGVPRPGFLVYLPHYARGAPIGTVEERRRALLGYAYAALRIREIFASAGAVPPELGIRVYEGDEVRNERVLYGEAGRDGVAHAVRQLSVAGKTWTVVYTDQAHPGIWGDFASAAVLVMGIGVSLLVYRLQAVQVRGRRRAELDADALREGERRYRFLAEAMPHVVFTTDPAGRVTYVNGRWPSARTGEPLSLNLQLALHAEDRGVLVAWEACLAMGTPWNASFRLWSGERGWRWHLACALPQVTERGVGGWVGTLTDIEAQKEAEAALQRETEELERRVEARTEALQRSVRELENFTAVASHDLQEPLRKIVAFGDRLAEALGPEVPPEASDALHRMRRSAQRLQQLISDLLTFVRVSRAEMVPTPVDLGLIVREVRDELLEGRTDGATIEVGALPTTLGDPGLLRHLVLNLLENALKFHRPGMPPRVRVHAEAAGDEVAPGERPQWFRLLVQDEGIGFDPKYLERIFQVFQRLHPQGRYEGTGIGLAICQRVVELHGGHITARGSPSAGACFVSTLPLAPAGTREEGCEPRRDTARSSSRRTTPTTVS